MCNVTCYDTFALSYATMVSDGPGCIANRAKYLKTGKYACITTTHHFVPIGVETTGVFGPEANYFLHELGVHLKI